jgi:cholesterol transport system auxiliary component
MMKRAILLSCAALLGGCGVSLLPARAPAPVTATYDFGAFPADPPARLTDATVVLRQVTAPIWLMESQIHYRLMYDDPRQLRSYADSHWAGAPTDLVAARVAHALAIAGTEAAYSSKRYSLYIDIPVFEQDFTAANAATAVVQLHAQLRDPLSGEAYFDRTFSESVATEASARGAADGLAASVDKITVELLGWLNEHPLDKH